MSLTLQITSTFHLIGRFMEAKWSINLSLKCTLVFAIFLETAANNYWLNGLIYLKCHILSEQHSYMAQKAYNLHILKPSNDNVFCIFPLKKWLKWSFSYQNRWQLLFCQSALNTFVQLKFCVIYSETCTSVILLTEASTNEPSTNISICVRHFLD